MGRYALRLNPMITRYAPWFVSVLLVASPACKDDSAANESKAAPPSPTPSAKPLPGAWDEAVAARCDDAHRTMLEEHIRAITRARRTPGGPIRTIAVPETHGPVVAPSSDALFSWGDHMTEVPDPDSPMGSKTYWRNGEMTNGFHISTVVWGLRHTPRPALAVHATQPAATVAEALVAMKEADVTEFDVVFSTRDGVIPPADPALLEQLDTTFDRARKEPDLGATRIGERTIPIERDHRGGFAEQDSTVEGIRLATATCPDVPDVFASLAGVAPAKRDEHMAVHIAKTVIECKCSADEPALLTYLYRMFVQRSRWTTRPAKLDPSAPGITLRPGQTWGDVASAWIESGDDVLWIVDPEG